eukprot:5054374-Alexandrium_andersonii.AAC.1
MSASLVGSEMCIRDSSRSAGPTAAGARMRRSSGGAFPSGGLGGMSLRPVSYTHLTLPTICSV